MARFQIELNHRDENEDQQAENAIGQATQQGTLAYQFNILPVFSSHCVTDPDRTALRKAPGDHICDRGTTDGYLVRSQLYCTQGANDDA